LELYKKNRQHFNVAGLLLFEVLRIRFTHAWFRETDADETTTVLNRLYYSAEQLSQLVKKF
jgi:hypothetical protein